MNRPQLALSEVRGWLARRHGADVSGLEELPSGFWSAAYGYEADGRELVLRVGTIPEGFAMDREAHRFSRPGLPIPEVLEVGEAFGFGYAISTRFHGRFLESIEPGEAALARPAVLELLDALRAVPAEDGAPADWYRAGDGSTWRSWLTAAVVDNPANTVSGWRATIAAEPKLDRLYRATEAHFEQLLDACPERRELIHGDLINRNVLIDDDLTRISAAFSWKCSARGDGLYDVAWCTMWSPDRFPGVAALDLWAATKGLASIGDDAAVRHHCYLLHMGLRQLGFHAWTGDAAELRSVAARTAEVLEAGPA